MDKEIKIPSKYDESITMKVVHGHFSSDRFHVNYYLDLSTLKTRHAEAKKVAKAMADRYVKRVTLDPKYLSSVGLEGAAMEEMAKLGASTKQIDTIICMDGCEVIGAYLADELLNVGFRSNTEHNSFYVITPEFDSSGQMVVRKNMNTMIKGRNVLVVLATAMSGRTIGKAIQTINAYGGKVQGLSVIFANTDRVQNLPVYGVFTHEDLPNFRLSSPQDCEDCINHIPLDAVVNAYGYEPL